MYYYEAMAEAAQKTDTDDLYDNIASKLETLCGLSNIMGQNFDRSEPDRLELECNYHQMQTASHCLTDYIYEVKELFHELEKRAGERGASVLKFGVCLVFIWCLFVQKQTPRHHNLPMSKSNKPLCYWIFFILRSSTKGNLSHSSPVCRTKRE